ncbi:hypothetical protein ACF0H5_005824 [Mactra antiquata]
MATTHCLYHSDQDSFISLQKDLIQCGWLPRKCAHRLAMAVCACRKRLGEVPSYEDQLANTEMIRGIIQSENAKYSNRIVTFINECLNLTNISNTNNDYNGKSYSYIQLITVLCNAKQQDFSMLSRASVSANSKFSERELQREINRKKKLTPHQVDMIIRKKKKKTPACLVKLPIFPGNLQKLLKLEYVSKSKVAIVEPHYTKNNTNFDNNRVESFVKVWGNPENIKTLTARMIQNAKCVQERMDAERERRQRVKTERRIYYDAIASLMGCSIHALDEEVSPWAFDSCKEALTDDFTLKAHKSARGKAKSQTVKTQSSVLDGGHCLQCFKSFTNLHDNTECTFHEGFASMNQLKGKKTWSCCKTVVEDSDTKDYLHHSCTGCTTSRVHAWRTHAKSKGKNKDKNDYKNM